jgi:hypothetical protein
MQANDGEQLRASPAMLVAAPRTVGRPPGRKNNRPNIRGWHEETEAARKLGVDIQTLRRKRRAGIGPKAWVREGRHILYRDGCEEEYLAEKLKATEDAEPRRGRRRAR